MQIFFSVASVFVFFPLKSRPTRQKNFLRSRNFCRQLFPISISIEILILPSPFFLKKNKRRRKNTNLVTSYNGLNDLSQHYPEIQNFYCKRNKTGKNKNCVYLMTITFSSSFTFSRYSAVAIIPGFRFNEWFAFSISGSSVVTSRPSAFHCENVTSSSLTFSWPIYCKAQTTREDNAPNVSS